MKLFYIKQYFSRFSPTVYMCQFMCICILVWIYVCLLKETGGVCKKKHLKFVWIGLCVNIYNVFRFCLWNFISDNLTLKEFQILIWKCLKYFLRKPKCKYFFVKNKKKCKNYIGILKNIHILHIWNKFLNWHW